MITFTKSKVDAFKHLNTHLRWGQAFFGYMKLEKVTNQQDKEFCDRLYNATDEKAKAMVASRLDRSN